jgi:hypothetical protein
MKCAVEMGSGAMIYVPSFINIGSGIQKLIGREYTDTHRQQRDLISLLYFFKIRKVGLLDHVVVCVCVSVYPPYRC